MLKYVDTELLNYGGSAACEGFMRQPEVRHLLALQVSWRLALAAAKGRTESPRAAGLSLGGPMCGGRWQPSRCRPMPRQWKQSHLPIATDLSIY